MNCKLVFKPLAGHFKQEEPDELKFWFIRFSLNCFLLCVDLILSMLLILMLVFELFQRQRLLIAFP